MAGGMTKCAESRDFNAAKNEQQQHRQHKGKLNRNGSVTAFVKRQSLMLKTETVVQWRHGELTSSGVWASFSRSGETHPTVALR